MTSDRYRRSLLNPQVDRRARFRLLMPFVILIAAVAMIGFSMNRTITAIGAQFSASFAEQTEATIQLNLLIEKVKTVILIDIGFIIVLALLLWAYYSFRIFGPLVAIYRHVHALISGEYTSRVKLRRHDEFMDLADHLNHLAEVLQERKTK